MAPTFRFTRFKLAGLVAGLAAFVFFAFFVPALRQSTEWGARPAFAAGGAALMAIWWLSEALPIYWTACVPLVLFPATLLFGPALGANLRETGLAYLDPYNFLFAGGMGIAAAMQQWGLHRRIALSIMAAIGSDPRRLLAGTLVATAFISLWISNTATAAMMLPIGIAIIAQIEAHAGGRRLAHYGMAVMLAIAYGANVGGIGTKIGTAPNAQLSGFLERQGTGVSFLQFLAIGLPFVLLFLPVVGWALWRLARREGLTGEVSADVVAAELAHLGPVKRPERIVLAVFAAAAALWIGSQWLTELLRSALPGLALRSAHVEGGTAVAAALALVAWRSRGRQVLEMGSLRHVPWETLLLLGGGFALAAAVQKSGLSAYLSAQLAVMRNLPPMGQVLLASVAAVGISAFASNTATIAVLLVVLREAVSPELLTTVLFAATLGCSCDFALPAGTPPNAIVFGSGYVTIPRMARTGFVLDLSAALLAALWSWAVVRWVM
jgi:sodium-dependent dicarboxylate transporter 2/3/5